MAGPLWLGLDSFIPHWKVSTSTTGSRKLQEYNETTYTPGTSSHHQRHESRIEYVCPATACESRQVGKLKVNEPNAFLELIIYSQAARSAVPVFQMQWLGRDRYASE